MNLVLHLIRHGESTGNLIRQLQSVLDTDLTDNGYIQAQALQGKFDVTVAYYSPLKRAKETARTIFENTDTVLVEHKDLIEEDVGVFVGKLWPDLSEEEVILWKQSRKDWDFVGHRGESGNQVLQRAVGAMNTIVVDMQQREIQEAVVISHGGLLGAFLRRYLGLDGLKIENCSIHTVEFNTITDEWQLVE